MITKMVDIKTPDGVADAFVAYPDQGSKFPAVILFIDAIGLREQVFAMAKKIAAQGYYVVAPNIFYRLRPAPIVDYAKYLKPENKQELYAQIMPLVGGYTPDIAKRDTRAFLDFVKDQSVVNPASIGVTGYCMGGGLALRAAAYFPDEISAAASYHAGRLVSDSPESIHRLVKDIKAEFYVAHADHDQSMPPESIEAFAKAVEAVKAPHDVQLYKDAPHGFTMADLPAYDAEGDKKHWQSLFELFKRRLKAA